MSRIQDALELAAAQRAERQEPCGGILALLRDPDTAPEGDDRVTAEDGQSCLFIGRGPTNDVAYDLFDDAGVSVRHAGVRLEDGDWVLYDMGSLNGTYLNDMPVERCVLSPGDAIGLGRNGPRLRVEIAPPRPTHPRPAAGAPTAPIIDPDVAQIQEATRESPIVALAEPAPTRGWRRREILLGVLAGLLAVKIGLDLVQIFGAA